MSHPSKAFKAKIKIKKGDTVLVTAGSSKGTTGEVLQILPKENRLIVDGANIRTKHVKASENNAGGRVDKIMPIHISNVVLIDPTTNQPTKVGRRIENNKIVRYAKASGKTLS